MITTFKSVEAYQRALVKRPRDLMPFNVSPGYATSTLGVSRQRVHQMIEQGVLDAIRTDDGIVLLRRAEIRAYHTIRQLTPVHQRTHMGRAWSKAKKQQKKPGLLTKLRLSLRLPDHD